MVLYLQGAPLDTLFQIWVYITFWIVLYFAGVYTLCGLYVGCRVISRWHGLIWAPPLALLVGAVVGFLTGAMPGLVIAGLYEVGGFSMTELHAQLWAVVVAVLMLYNSLGRKYYTGGKHFDEVELSSTSGYSTPRHRATGNKKFGADTSDAF